MKERPKLLNTEMVKAVLSGRKTQTRIPIPSRFYGVEDTDKHDHSYFYVPDKYGDYHHITDFAGFPQVDDLLYVREKWTLGAVVCAEGDEWYVSQCKGEDEFIPYEAMLREDIGIEEVSWKPSIHMHKKNTRIWLKVKRVWVERVQDITEGEALKEGVKPSPIGITNRTCFRILWNSIYGKTHDKWDNNRHVVACEFERPEKPGFMDSMGAALQGKPVDNEFLKANL